MNGHTYLEMLDPIQEKLLEECCILLDDQDRVIGSDSKKNCHLMENIRQGKLHRAFSVFMFNSKGELLLQQRSDSKITFPGCYTNTCCSHPLFNALELEEDQAMGVKRAAQRKLDHELGVPSTQVPLDKFVYITRIHYMAPSDGKWGEHEIDYILFIQADVDVTANANEVQSHCYATKEQVLELMERAERGEVKVTPWFKLIVDRYLIQWWNSLGDIQSQVDTDTIRKM